MRLLYLILDGFPTFRPDVRSLWGRYLPAQGIHSDLSTIENTDPADPAAWGGGKVFLYRRRGSRIAQHFGMFCHDCGVLMQARRGGYAAIQVRDKSFIAAPALLAARLLGIPFYYWMSYPIAESLVRLKGTLDWRRDFLRKLLLWYRGTLGKAVLYRLIMPLADHIFVQSDRMAADLAAMGLERRKMTPVPMCIDPERFAAPLPAVKQGNAVGRRVVGYLGECSRVRRIDFLLDAVLQARREIPDILFLIVGDATEEADQRWLRREVERRELAGTVHITGWIEPAAVSATFASVDVALALMVPDPLLDSATPTKLVEYLAMGRPVVANHHPDQTAVIEQSGGGIVAELDAGSYAAAMVSLLRDPDLCAAMAARGRAYVLEHRSYPEMAKRLAAIYQRLLQASRA